MFCALSGVYILTTALIPMLEKENDPRVVSRAILSMCMGDTEFYPVV